MTNARQISIKAEVDMEMVRACLRVLKHHGVIALVDMFMYSNRYEFTDKATAMLAGKEPKLLTEALDFVMKKPEINVLTQGIASVKGGGSSGIPPFLGGGTSAGSDSSHPFQIGSPFNSQTPSSSYPPRTMNLLGGSQRSSNFRFAMMAAQSLDKDSSIAIRQEEQPRFKSALAELYCACNRNMSFGDLWLSLTTESPPSLVLPSLNKLTGSHHSVMYNLRQNTRKNSITEEEEYPMENIALSPLETIQLDALRRDRDKEGEKKVDWNDFFNKFDHRRFFTFGMVHGLVVRVHNYPYFPGVFPQRSISISNLTNVSMLSYDSKQNLKTEFSEERAYELAKSIAYLMDGTKCDDELVCIFEKPFHQLVELVEKYGGKKIVSVFAPAPDV